MPEPTRDSARRLSVDLLHQLIDLQTVTLGHLYQLLNTTIGESPEVYAQLLTVKQLRMEAGHALTLLQQLVPRL